MKFVSFSPEIHLGRLSQLSPISNPIQKRKKSRPTTTTPSDEDLSYSAKILAPERLTEIENSRVLGRLQELTQQKVGALATHQSVQEGAHLHLEDTRRWNVWTLHAEGTGEGDVVMHSIAVVCSFRM